MERKINGGSGGSVFRVIRVRDRAIFAMKRIPLLDLSDEDTRQVKVEVELAQRMHHPYLIECVDTFLFNGEDLCIVMPFVNQGDLSGVILTRRGGGSSSRAAQLFPAGRHGVGHRGASPGAPFEGTFSDSYGVGLMAAAAQGRGTGASHANGNPLNYFPEPLILRWLTHVLLGLHFLHHHGIAHRDVKPQNIFIDGDTGDAVLGDLGVSAIVYSAEERLAETDGPVKGTPLYMSPEVLRGQPASFANDIWALGCVAFELMRLAHPFDARDITTLVLKIARGDLPAVPLRPPRDDDSTLLNVHPSKWMSVPTADGTYSRALVDLAASMLTPDPVFRLTAAELLRAPVLQPSLSMVMSEKGLWNEGDRSRLPTVHPIGLNATSQGLINLRQQLSIMVPGWFLGIQQGATPAGPVTPRRTNVLPNIAFPCAPLQPTQQRHYVPVLPRSGGGPQSLLTPPVPSSFIRHGVVAPLPVPSSVHTPSRWPPTASSTGTMSSHQHQYGTATQSSMSPTTTASTSSGGPSALHGGHLQRLGQRRELDAMSDVSSAPSSGAADVHSGARPRRLKDKDDAILGVSPTRVPPRLLSEQCRERDDTFANTRHRFQESMFGHDVRGGVRRAVDLALRGGGN